MPVDALEATAVRRRVRAGSVRQEHSPFPFVIVDPCDVVQAARRLRTEILRLQRTGAGAYVFIDREMNCYVVSELRSVAATWVKVHFGWLVGFYTGKRLNGEKRNPDGTPYLTATVAGLTEDVTEHLKDLARLA